MTEKQVYLDYAATTRIDPRVLRAMEPYFTKYYANPNSLHTPGQKSAQAVEKARTSLAQALKVQPEEIYFTSSATESNNWALKGIAWANMDKGRHIIISSIEHDCVLNTAQWLKTQGFTVDVLPVGCSGLVDPEEFKRLIKKDTILVSVMHANNEVGTIQPIGKISRICQKHNLYFHTDAAQTFGKIPLDLKKTRIDLLTASSHKIYGPKGVAILYVKKGTKIEPMIYGGGQEKGKRSSTLNVPGIVGFAKAIEIAVQEMKEEGQRQTKLRDKLIQGVLDKIDDCWLNGAKSPRLPNNANFGFARIEGEGIILHLDDQGVFASTGSACASQDLQPSHVLLALGLKPQQAHGSLRLSLGRWTTKSDIGYTLEVLPKVIKKLKKLSPFKK